MRLIDADKLLSEYQTICSSIRCYDCQFNGEWGDKGCQLEALIKDASTIEPVRHGHWYDVSNYLGTGKAMYVCSECGAGSSREDPYCWHCGSKMDVSDTDVGKMEGVEEE